MKLEIITQAKHVEVVNFILGAAIKSLELSEGMRKELKLTAKDIEGAEMFRKKLVNSLLKSEL